MPSAASWTPPEDVALCRAYTNISEDGATSTDQSSSLFWDRIQEAFTQLIGSEGAGRNSGALQSRWSGLIRPDVCLYASCHASVKAEEHSGWTDEDYEAEARNRFMAKREQQNSNSLREYEEAVKKGTAKKKRKPRVKQELFRLDHCYDVLRQSVRFMREIPQPRKRPRLSLTSGADNQESEQIDSQAEPTETSNRTSDDTFDGADILQSPITTRPPSPSYDRPNASGKKKQKQIYYEEQIDKAMMLSQRELAKATTAQVQIMQQQLEVAKQKVAILATQQQALNDQAEMSMMCASTEGLSEFGKEYLQIKQRQLLEKLKKQ